MQYRDSRDLSLTAESKSSAARYDELVELVARYHADPFSPLERALADDPGFLAGHTVRAAIGVMAAERGAEPLIRQSLAEAAASRTRPNERERRHLGAAESWLQGDFHRAADLYAAIALDYPRDLLALQVAHVCDFYLGRQRMLRDRVVHALPSYHEGIPGYGFLLGMLAFGLEETNHFERAEAAAMKALAEERRDVWAIHAVAHVFEMTGQIEAGASFLETRSGDWAPENAFAYHHFWHLALFELERNDVARVFELFDRSLWPKPSSVGLEMVDAASLLFRLHLRGIDVGKRALAVADAWSAPVHQGFYAFNDAHAAMAFVAAGRLDEARRLVADLARRAGEESSNGSLTREVGLPLAQALLAFGEERYGEVVRILSPLRLVAHGFGGSNAQRDVIDQTLAEAALRSGDRTLTRALVAERRLFRPASAWARRLELRLAAHSAARGHAAE